jgi:hypothetical protein
MERESQSSQVPSHPEPLTEIIPPSNRYSAWFGESVVLVIVIGKCHVQLPCIIVGESVGEVCIYVEPGRKINVRKQLILAVEEEAEDPDGLISGYSGYLN